MFQQENISLWGLAILTTIELSSEADSEGPIRFGRVVNTAKPSMRAYHERIKQGLRRALWRCRDQDQCYIQ